MSIVLQQAFASVILARNSHLFCLCAVRKLYTTTNHQSRKPWPNAVASQRKIGDVNLRTRTYDGWPNRLASTRKFNASSKKAISVQPRTRLGKPDLRRLALGGQTV